MTGPPPPPWSPPPPGRGRRSGSVPLLVLVGLCWLGFAVSLVAVLFVWLAVGDGRNGTGLAWPITAVSAALLALALTLGRWVDSRGRRR